MNARRPRRRRAPEPHEGLYLITPDEADTARLRARASSAVLRFGDAAAVPQQVGRRCAAARAGARRCSRCAAAPACRWSSTTTGAWRTNSAPTARISASDDGDVARGARRRSATIAILGVSCYDDLRARRSGRGARARATSPSARSSPRRPSRDARRATLQLLRDAGALGLPRVAIGGITPDNARVADRRGRRPDRRDQRRVRRADPVAAARAYRACFD